MPPSSAAPLTIGDQSLNGSDSDEYEYIEIEIEEEIEVEEVSDDEEEVSKEEEIGKDVSLLIEQPDDETRTEMIGFDDEKAPQCDVGMMRAETTYPINESSKEVTGGDAVTSLNESDKVPHLEEQSGDAVTGLNESDKVPHLEEQSGDAVTCLNESNKVLQLEEQITQMSAKHVNEAQQTEPRLDVPLIRPRSLSPGMEVSEGNKRPAPICDSPAIDVTEGNKRPALVCDFFAKGWCIKGSSCKFRHIKDTMNYSDQQKETSVAAHEKCEPHNDEGLATSVAAPSVTCSSEIKPELQNENTGTRPSLNNLGTQVLEKDNPPVDADSSLHETSSNLIEGSDTHRSNWVSSYATTMEEPDGRIYQFRLHNPKVPITSYTLDHNSTLFHSNKIMSPSDHTSVWPKTSSFLTCSTLKHLGSQSEHVYPTKISTYDWEPSKPYRSAFLISQGISTPDIQYDPIRDSIESPKIGDKFSKFSYSSRVPSISSTHSPKNVNPPLKEIIGTTNVSDRGSLASHVNDNDIDMDVTSEKGAVSTADTKKENTKTVGKGKVQLTPGNVSHFSLGQNGGPAKEVRVRDESSQYHKIELDPEGDMHREPKALRLFRAALIEFIKELVKPTWRDGKLSKDAHKLIVKKAVDKVLSTLPADHIPSMQESIDMYLSSSKPKLQKLAEGYIEKYGKL